MTPKQMNHLGVGIFLALIVGLAVISSVIGSGQVADKARETVSASLPTKPVAPPAEETASPIPPPPPPVAKVAPLEGVAGYLLESRRILGPLHENSSSLELGYAVCGALKAGHTPEEIEAVIATKMGNVTAHKMRQAAHQYLCTLG